MNTTIYRTVTCDGMQQVGVEEALRLLQQGTRVELLRENGDAIPVSREDVRLAKGDQGRE